ncbi:hypothetical protein [Neobacillus kokaensis]|uniref:Uncharacterized protein n=1 Tax=Neobacillus kokaensis TaxID=2759023 RepID=A0ABQ3MY73_9BACI|nr:hypothetical protein [Neobacillus kokaensis]GHH96801.1 hypothetical protein AM1BK_03440 [Neobacillus kokaensis]
MKGIYFINDRMTLDGFAKEDSILLQTEPIMKYIKERNIQVVKLNPYQLNDYYTNPHALLYDLKKENKQLDCLIYFSLQVLEDYIYSYPAKWLILKSFFKEVVAVENQNDHNIQRVI